MVIEPLLLSQNKADKGTPAGLILWAFPYLGIGRSW